MGNKHTKLKKKPTIEQFMRAQIMRIKAVVPGMNVTITDDNMDGVIHTLQRRRDEVVASQQGKSND